MARARRKSRLVPALLLASTMALSLAVVQQPTAGAELRERPDRTWMANGKVFALARAGNMLLIGGRFSKLLPPRGSAASPIAVRNLAALDIDTGRPLAFAPQVAGPDAEVRALAVADGRLYVGGMFSTLAGSAAKNIGAVRLADASRVASFSPAMHGPVYALLASTSRLYAGGAFGRVDSAPRAKLAAWDMPAGGLSKEWRPQTASGAVRDLEFDVSKSSIFIAGAFSAMTQEGTDFKRTTLAKADAGDGRLLPWSPRRVVGDPQTAWAVDATRRRLHGGFGRGSNYAASFRSGGPTGDRTWRFPVTGNVQTVELSAGGSRLYVGGHFGLNGRSQRLCGTQVRGLLAVNPSTGTPQCRWLPRIAPFDHNYNGPWAMIETGRGLWVAGGFTTIGGREQRNIARFPK